MKAEVAICLSDPLTAEEICALEGLLRASDPRVACVYLEDAPPGAKSRQQTVVVEGVHSGVVYELDELITVWGRLRGLLKRC